MGELRNKKIILAAAGIIVAATGIAAVIFSAPTTTSAQAVCTTCRTGWVPFGEGCKPESGVGFEACPSSTPTQPTGEAATQSANGRPAEPTFGCNGIISCDVKSLLARVAYIIMSLFGILLGLAGVFLDFVISITILNLPAFVNNLAGLEVGWRLIRDVLNLCFIFILLYTAIRTILGDSSYQKVIVKIVLAGLLINFSFFFTKVAIDASNILTIQLYNGIQRVGEKYQAVEINSPAERLSGIAAALMNGISPQKMFEAARKSGAAGKPEFESHIFQQMVFGSIILLIAAFVFFAIALMLLVRFVVFLVLLLTSPIAFMSGLLPQLDKQAKMWREALIGQAVFAPVLMLFMLATVLIVNDPKFQSSLNLHIPAQTGGFAGTFFEFVGGSAAGLVSYLLVIGLMIMGLVIAKQFASAAGAGIVNWTQKKATAIAQSPLTFARWAGRGAAGAAGAVGGGAKMVGGIAAREGVGRMARYTGKQYDVLMGKAAQLDYKKETGWRKAAAAAAGVATFTRADEKIRDRFKAFAGSRFGTQESLEEKERAKLERRRQLGQAVVDSKQKQTLEDGIKETKTTLANGTYDSKTNTAVDNYLKEVGKLADNKIEDLLAKNVARLKDESFAGALNARQMDVVNKSTVISDKDKDDIRRAHEHGLGARMGSTFDPTTKTWSTPTRVDEAERVVSGRPADVAQLPAAILKTDGVARKLSSNVLSQIANAGKMGDVDRQAIRDAIQNARVRNIPAGATTQQINAVRAENARLLGAKAWLNSPAGAIF